MPHKIIKSISDRMRERNMLEYIVDTLYKDFGLVPVIGTEIEFYIIGENINDVILKFVKQPSIYPIKQEKGSGQFEIDIFPQANIHKTIEEITRAKTYLKSLPNISLHPKPYPHDYGSAMHFHVNFLNKNGENFFDINNNLEHAAKSLCHFLPTHFLAFAPKADHYSRFDKNFMAPTHICFGGNNRSVAIRIPDARPRRLEHRISSPETDEYLAIYAILMAIYQGLQTPALIRDYQKIHGNAYDDQYGLESLPKTIEDAIRLWKM